MPKTCAMCSKSTRNHPNADCRTFYPDRMTDAEKLTVLTNNAMVNGLESLTETERKTRDRLAIKLLYTKDSKGRLSRRAEAR